MKKSLYVILYSLLVNGEEYPRQSEFYAISVDDAKKELDKAIAGKCDYRINQVTLK
ncbi:MAG: hypothetical protein ACOYN5_10985 [Bacteroidales bacterium]